MHPETSFDPLNPKPLTPDEASRTLKRPAPSDSDSEWEYEYSATETETFYITLDISTSATNPNNHGGPRKKYQKRSVPTPTLTTRSKNTQEDQAAQTDAENGNATNNDDDEAVNTNVTINDPGLATEKENGAAELDPLIEAEAPQDQDNEEPNGPSSRIQVLDLHTKHPLISYQGTIYSCTWTQPLGTDILLTTPSSSNIPIRDLSDRRGVATNLNATGDAVPASAMRGTKESPVLAFSEVRLMARPMKAVLVGEGLEKEKGIGAKKKGRPRKEKGVEKLGFGGLTVDEDAQVVLDKAPTPTGAENTPARAASPPEQLPRTAFATPPPPPLSTASPAPIPQAQGTLSTGASPSKPPQQSQPPSPSQETPSLLQGALGPKATKARRAQANFLEQLIAAKTRAGETDSVTVFATKTNTGTGWRAQQRIKGQGKAKRKDIGKGVGAEDGELILIEEGDESQTGQEVEEMEGELEDDAGPTTAYQVRTIREATKRVRPREGFTARGRTRTRAGRGKVANRVRWQEEDRGSGRDDSVNVTMSGALNDAEDEDRREAAKRDGESELISSGGVAAGVDRIGESEHSVPLGDNATMAPMAGSDIEMGNT